MKVSNNNSNAINSSQLGKATSAQSAEEAKKSKGSSTVGAEELSGAAKVEVSGRARDVQKAKDIAMGGPSVDEAKVARLQKLIDEGKYKIDAQSIADKLVDEHMLMPS